MPSLNHIILITIMGLVSITIANADINTSMSAIKIETITQMYQHDVLSQGQEYPVTLEQYANPELQAAMQLEVAYFEQEQMSCHIGYDVLWSSQDPDYYQDKQFSMNAQGLVIVSLTQGSDIYYQLSCDENRCQVADVILEDGLSLREYLLEACR